MMFSSLPGLLVTAVLAGPASVPGQPAAADAPRRLIEDFHAGLVQIAADRQDLQARVAALQPIVMATHDFPYIARFSLRRHWPDLTEAEQQSFISTFIDLSVLTYATRFQGITGDSFSIYNVSDASGGRLQVEAAINRPNDTPIPIIYLVHWRDDGWRIINIIADGVSDLALKRAEYQRVWEQDSFAGLLAHLRRQMAALGISEP